jgi:hypothetical protein
MDVDEVLVDRISNEMCANVDVFHAGVGLGIMGASDGSLVVAIKGGGLFLCETEFEEKGTEPKKLSSTM